MSRPPPKAGFNRPPSGQALKQLFLSHYRAGQFEAALNCLRPFLSNSRSPAGVFHDAAVAALGLERWQEALGYARRAATLAPNKFSHYDAVSHAAGALKDWKLVQSAGLKALMLRDASVPAAAPVALALKALNPNANLDVIAFSLFGGGSKYCETAVLNCIEQPALYPGWICRFYVDATVPADIIDRLKAAGGEIVFVSPAMQAWPGPMWRFAALDDERVRRVIFRDADSVISAREAGAVAQWIEQDTDFHAMRDSGTHTELMLAGLWGAKAGVLPPIQLMIEHYLKVPPESSHFADQLFLRHYVWPYARQSMTQHDSLFGFAAGLPFPEGAHREDFHTGYAEGSPVVSISTQQGEGKTVYWCINDLRVSPPKPLCRYPATIVAGHVQAHVPARYVRLMQSGQMSIYVELLNDAQLA